MAKKISKSTQKPSSTKTTKSAPEEKGIKITTPEGHYFFFDASNIQDVCVEDIDFESLEYEEDPERPGYYKIEAVGKVVFRGLKAHKSP